MIRKDKFHEIDLEQVEYQNPVVLNSGGPIMEVETDEGDQVLCSWDEDGKTVRKLFLKACVSRLVPYAQNEQ